MSRTTLWLLVALCCATLTIGVAFIGIYVVAALQSAHSKIDSSDLSCQQHFCSSEATKHAYPDCICKLRDHPKQDKFHIRKFSSKKLCSKIKEFHGSEYWKSSNYNCFLANRDTGCPMPASSASVSALSKTITRPYSTGCPLLTAEQDQTYPALIHDDHCVKKPFFSTYFRTKFRFPTFRSLDREVSLYLNNTMDKFWQDYEDIDEEVKSEFLKSEDFNNIPYELDQFSTFKEDYLGELKASTNYYFMFQWKHHPMYKTVLKDNDPLLTPTIELKDRPDRKKWREETKNKLLGHRCSGFTDSQPMLTFVAGGPSSGKSTFFKKHLAPDSNSFTFISADAIKEMDPIFQQIRKLGDYRAADVVHAESSELAREIFTTLLQNRHRACNHVVFESAMGEYERYRNFVELAKANGFKVRIFAVTTEAGAAMKRALRRSIINERFVHSDIVLGSHKNFSIYFEQFANIVDEVELYDTSIVSKAILIASKATGAPLQILDAALYQVFLNKKNINDDADNVVEVHEDTAVASPLGSELYLGSCATNPIGLERYIRLYLMMRANLREECVCFYSTHAEPQLNK